MSAQRDELHQIVEELPEEAVPVVLAELRARVVPKEARRWPPSWFGAANAREPDISERVDEVLRDELGRRYA
jgi:hypothetical protein